MKPECKQCEFYLAHKFKKPTVEQIQKYCEEIGYPQFDSQHFFDKQEMNGWVVKVGNGFKQMASWKGAIRTWIRAMKRRGELQEPKKTAKQLYQESENG